MTFLLHLFARNIFLQFHLAAESHGHVFRHSATLDWSYNLKILRNWCFTNYRFLYWSMYLILIHSFGIFSIDYATDFSSHATRAMNLQTSIMIMMKTMAIMMMMMTFWTISLNWKMTGGTPEVRSEKSLTLLTFNIWHSINGPMDQWTNGPMDQLTNGPMGQWTNGRMY